MTSDAIPPDERLMTGPDAAAVRGSPADVGVRTIGRQAILNVGSLALAGVYTIWLTAYLVTQLGDEQFGAWVTIAAVLTPLLVLDAGLGLLVIRAAAAHATRPDESAV